MVGTPNLLLHPSELADALGAAVRGEDRLNAFLLAAGLGQIGEDYLHVSPLFSVEVAARLAASGRARLATGPRLVAAGAGRVRGYGPGSRRVRSWKREVEALVSATADLAEGGRPAAAIDPGALADRIVAAVPALPRPLRQAVLKVPAGFHAFDLQQADLRELVARFAARHRDRRRPLLVVGVRTSGSYFAPLCASSLRARGYESVEWLTVRPGVPLHPPEQRIVRSLAKRDGLVLVVDDPPGTGRSFATSAQMMCRLGVPHGSVVMLVPAFGTDAAPPPLLAGYEVVVLPESEWAIHSQLTPGRVRATLADLLGAELEPGAVEQLALPERDSHRGHEHALFRVDRRLVLAEGVGTGYFGEQALAVARELGDYVPAIHGLRDGILYREWLPEAARASDSPRLARLASITTIAQYVHARSERLAVDGDRSLAEAGRDPVWEVAASILSHAFGRAWPLARLAFMDRAAKLLLRPSCTSVVDGHTDVREWIAGRRREHPFVKVGFADRSFWHLGLGCCDPVFDLAGTDPGAADRSFSLELRAAYEQLSGEAIDPERWLLYELAHLWGRRRSDPADHIEIQRRLSRAVRDYIAEVLLADAPVPIGGRLCALDVDGVVETDALGFPAPSVQSALALRALMCHGFRSVLVSGRSSGEIAERCASYRLAGGVGEYGAVVYDALTKHEDCLVSPDELAVLESVRAQIAREDGVTVNRDYLASVRAFRIQNGHTRGLEAALIERALETSAQGRITAVHGEGQTDFTISRVDKAGGLGSLTRRLKADGGAIALAIGDSVSDLPMLAVAEHAVAPANADAAVRGAGVEVLSKPYQAGLAQGVARLIGHPPGGCELCRAPALSARTEFVLAVLSAREEGAASMAATLARLTWSGGRL
jgi:3-deoxy-D-manno-octulosonate 8-phosphate phosphatase KdsC-like HAD superfamily phosphatase